MTENWYIVLGLDWDQNPVNDEAVIEQRIEERSKFWSDNVSDPVNGVMYSEYLSLLPAIRKDMIGSDNIRAELISDACNKTYAPIDKTLKMIKKTDISQITIDKMASRLNVDSELVKRRAIYLGMNLTESTDINQVLYDKYYRTRPENFDKYDEMNVYLGASGVSNLYDFLYEGTSIKNPNKLSYDVLAQRASECKGKILSKSGVDEEPGYKLCCLCEECFSNPDAKKTYDNYLEYINRVAVLNDAKAFFESNGAMPEKIYVSYVGRLTELLENRQESEELLAAFCRIERIPVSAASEKTSNKANSLIKKCRCGFNNDISDGRTTCISCGMDLQVKCPRCGQVNDTIINICKCGFDLWSIDKASSLCELAAASLDMLDLDSADRYINDAYSYYPESTEVNRLRTRYTNLKANVGSVIKSMHKACDEKRYYEASKHLDSIKKKFPRFEDPLLEKEIYTSIESAEKYKVIAHHGLKETEVADACIKAYEICKDCPGIREIILKYPLTMPTELVVDTDPIARVNILSWQKSSARGLIYYNVVRKEGSAPSSIEDGTFVGRVSDCSIKDLSAEAGVLYFYSVFAERAGVYSNALKLKEPVSNQFEIAGLNITNGDGILRLTWNQISDNAEVNIDRINPSGKSVKLSCENKESYIDSKLDNDKEYTYNLSLTYTVGRTKIKTSGVTIKGIPTVPPLPIKNLVARYTGEDDFQATWENPNKNTNEVIFFYSTSKPQFVSGEQVMLAAIEKSMNVLKVKKLTDTMGTFKYFEDELIYVMAVVSKFGLVTIGNISRVCRHGTVKINSANSVNGKILLSAELPKDATGFVVLYRHDQFAQDIDDSEASRVTIPIKQYQHDCGLLIDSNIAADYYFSIFAEYRRDSEYEYSVGTDYLFSNFSKETITYSINVSRKLFGGGVVKLTFEGPKNFRLPDIDIISAVDRAPMFRKSGNIMYQIESREVRGSITITIPFDKELPLDSYIRPFLKDENEAKKYILKIKLESSNKIS